MGVESRIEKRPVRVEFTRNVESPAEQTHYESEQRHHDPASKRVYGIFPRNCSTLRMGSVETEETMESYGTRIGAEGSKLHSAMEWLLIDGNRLSVTAGLVIAVFALLSVCYWLGVISFVNDNSMTRVASGMIAGTFSLVTLVVSINQLILSNEFSTAGEFRDELDGILQFRHDIENVTGVPATPASPSKVFALLAHAVDDHASTLSDHVADDPDGEVSELVQRYLNQVDRSTQHLEEEVEAATFGTFNTISAVINFNDAWLIYAATHIRNAHEETFSEEALAEFDRLLEALQQITVAREHFVTTYMQRELTRFSQLTIYFGLPSVLSAVFLGFLYADLRGLSIGFEYAPSVVIALVTIVVTPLALLASYILRTATVAHRTTSVGPMIPQKPPEEGPFDVSYSREE